MKQNHAFYFNFLIEKILLSSVFFLLTSFIGEVFGQTQQIEANGITLAYESLGHAENETILLIAGTGMQLTGWPPELCNKLVSYGYRVIRYDNRDVGLSEKMTDVEPLDWPAISDALGKGKPAPLPYMVDDMAKDVVALLKTLGIAKAHIAGVSGGAIIAQIVAAQFPEHVLSLTSLMGTTGNPALPPIKPELTSFFASLPNPAPKDTMAIVARKVKIFQALASPDYPTDELKIKDYVMGEMKRCYYPTGEDRQGAAALFAGDRRNELKTIKLPVVVLHGQDDPIVPVEAGIDVASHIPGAELRIIPGMGHDIPEQLIHTIADAIADAARKTHVLQNENNK